MIAPNGDLTRQSVVGADISQASDGDIRTTRQRQSGRRHENRAARICAKQAEVWPAAGEVGSLSGDAAA